MSALVGEPPNTPEDYYIVRGLLRYVLQVDAADPAAGYTLAVKKPSPDYTYTSRQPGIVAGLCIVLIVIIVPTGARLVLRASIQRMRFGADDWATIVAASCAITYTVLQIIMAFNGGGHHVWDVTYAQYNTFNYFGVLCKVFFYLCVGLNKLSLTLFIRRLADRTSRPWRWFCDFYLVTVAAYMLLAVVWTLLTCRPAAAQWDKLYAGRLATPARCEDTVAQAYVLNITHVVQGTLLLLSPMVILWRVRIERARKTRLYIIWAVGAVAVLCGLMRQLRNDFTSDIFWTYTELLVWTSLDVSIGVLVISLPVMDAWLAGAWGAAVSRLAKHSYYANGGRGRGRGAGSSDNNNVAGDNGGGAADGPGGVYTDGTIGGSDMRRGSRRTPVDPMTLGDLASRASSTRTRQDIHGLHLPTLARRTSLQWEREREWERPSSDSAEKILHKEQSFEMAAGIVRTDEVDIRYEEEGGLELGGHDESGSASPRVYDKNRVTGLEEY